MEWQLERMKKEKNNQTNNKKITIHTLQNGDIKHDCTTSKKSEKEKLWQIRRGKRVSHCLHRQKSLTRSNQNAHTEKWSQGVPNMWATSATPGQRLGRLILSTPCPGKLWSNSEETHWKRNIAPFPSHRSQRPHTYFVHFKCRNWGIKPCIQRYRVNRNRKSSFHLSTRWWWWGNSWHLAPIPGTYYAGCGGGFATHMNVSIRPKYMFLLNQII